ncbi:type IVB secretion system protein IcmH/DotU [Pantoea sp. Tr-811]|uniref:type IVB secretion system protein IcmH/DotU n=1 Tax=Pantoea sp. Tr-811 TaxID=2608361 RepID=UPI0019623995|nr:type IVB secretion system protein IcmH/DotU [Pantoea sp. Tr-811]
MPSNTLLPKLTKHAEKHNASPSSTSTTRFLLQHAPGDPDFDLRTGFMNPMCNAALSLLGLALRLETLDDIDDLEELYRVVSIQITNILAEMAQLPYEPLQVSAFSYALCLYLDQTVMDRPWGKVSVWSHMPLLSEFHDDALGGEKFFVILERMKQEPARFVDVLEFMYLVLCMGLKGKYAVVPGGDKTLEAHIAELRTLISKQRGPLPELFPDALSNVAPRNFRMRRHWPWWSPLVLATGMITGMYAYYSYRLRLVTAEVLDSLNLILQ